MERKGNDRRITVRRRMVWGVLGREGEGKGRRGREWVARGERAYVRDIRTRKGPLSMESGLTVFSRPKGQGEEADP